MDMYRIGSHSKFGNQTADHQAHRTSVHLPKQYDNVRTRLNELTAQSLCLLTSKNYHTMLQLQQVEQNRHRCNNSVIDSITEPFHNNFTRNHPMVVSAHTGATSSLSGNWNSILFPGCLYGVTTDHKDHVFQRSTSCCSNYLNLPSSLSSQLQTVLNTTNPTTPNTIANTAFSTALVEKEDVIMERKRKFHETSLLLSRNNIDNSDVAIIVKAKKKRELVCKSTTSSNKKSKKDTMNEDDSQTLFGYNPGMLIPLSCPDDDSDTFSGFTKLLRDQIYILHAGQYDIYGNTCGRNKPIRLGQIGFVCKHCVNTPPGLRPNGAAYFPSKLKYVYQASINMYHNHLKNNCRNIPSETIQELETLRVTKRKGCKKSMWVDSCIKMGIVECSTDDNEQQQSYLQFRRTITATSSTTTTSTSDNI